MFAHLPPLKRIINALLLPKVKRYLEFQGVKHLFWLQDEGK